jgi:dolichol-phosphate mannosyltransferase
MRIIATLPTYNEAENIESLVSDLLALGPEIEVLVVDDNSPDGTWLIVRDMASAQTRVHLLRRTTERGRGTAGLAGFRWARDAGADAVVEMDADYSHHPRFIPDLLEPIRAGEADIVVGSRLVSGGGEEGRSISRRLITSAANLYIKTVLGLTVHDCTSGFRTFSRKALELIPWESMTATGPEIVQEVLCEGRKARLRMVERPILFEERRAGESTFNVKIMIRSFLYVLRLRLGWY